MEKSDLETFLLVWNKFHCYGKLSMDLEEIPWLWKLSMDLETIPYFLGTFHAFWKNSMDLMEIL